MTESASSRPGSQDAGAVQSGGRGRVGRVIVALLAAIGAVLLVALASGVWQRHQTGTTTQPSAPPTPVILALAQTGPMRGSRFLSNERVTLSWSGAPGAPFYRLQVATTSPFASKRARFRHPLLTTLVYASSYSLPVVGAQVYVWRVQPFLNGRWQPYSRPRRFVVREPDAPSPRPLSPPSGTVVARQPVRLCWSAVGGSIGYLVDVAPAGATVTAGTCLSLHLDPGRYSWRVASYVQGAKTYNSPFSAPAEFSVPAPVAAYVAPPRSSAPVSPPVQAPPAAAPLRSGAVSPTRRIPVVPVRPVPVIRVAPVPARPVPPPRVAPAPKPAQRQNSKTSNCIPFVNC